MNTKKARKKRIRHIKSFSLSSNDQMQLDYLSKAFGLNSTEIFRKLLSEAFSSLKEKESESS